MASLSEADAFTPLDGPAGVLRLRASCVALGGRALLLAGPSGSGKSSLALELMAMGAGLVADDVTEVFLDDVPMARAPSSLPAMIEARGIGLLQTELVPQAQAFVALDLAKSTDVRMPEPQFIRLMGYDVPLLHRPAGGPVAAMLLQYLKSPSE